MTTSSCSKENQSPVSASTMIPQEKNTVVINRTSSATQPAPTKSWLVTCWVT
jgi:hypothetical protein